MTCPICPQKLTYQLIPLMHTACGPCQRHLKQMLAGFHGVIHEQRQKRVLWNNTGAYEDWKAQLTANDDIKVRIKDNAEYTEQVCDIRDMKRVCGIPKFLSLEKQVFTAWILEGQKDERIQEVMGLSYSQLIHIKKVVKIRLQKQMAYYHQIKKLEEQAKDVPMGGC